MPRYEAEANRRRDMVQWVQQVRRMQRVPRVRVGYQQNQRHDSSIHAAKQRCVADDWSALPVGATLGAMASKAKTPGAACITFQRRVTTQTAT